MSTTADLSQRIGDTQKYSLTFTEDGSPLDITGATIYLTVKKDLSDTDLEALFQKVVTAHTDPAQGETEIVVNPADTSSLECGSYFYDIQVTTAGGEIYTPLLGKYTLGYEVTLT